MTLPPYLTPNQQAIADALKEHGELSLNGLKSKTDLSFDAVSSALIFLERTNAIASRSTDASMLYRLKEQPSST